MSIIVLQNRQNSVISRNEVTRNLINKHEKISHFTRNDKTLYFAKTNDKGKVELSIPISIDSVSIWHPRMRENDKRPVTIAKDNQTHFTFQLKKPMSEDTEGYEDLSLDVY